MPRIQYDAMSLHMSLSFAFHCETFSCSPAIFFELRTVLSITAFSTYGYSFSSYGSSIANATNTIWIGHCCQKNYIGLVFNKTSHCVYVTHTQLILTNFYLILNWSDLFTWPVKSYKFCEVFIRSIILN